MNLVEKLFQDWLLVESSHKISKAASNKLWKIAMEQLEKIFKLKEQLGIRRKIPQFSQIRRRLKKKNLPRISMKIAYKEKSTGNVTIVEDTAITPTSKFPPHLYTKLYEEASVSAKDILQLHASKCPNPQKNLQLSCDGVAECRSNSVTLDVYSVRAVNCRQIYPVKIIRPLNRYKIDHKEHLREILNDFVRKNSCCLKHYIGDNPKRAIAKDCLNHASLFACEYCFSCAIRLKLASNSDELDEDMTKKILREKLNILKEKPLNNEIKKEIKKLTALLVKINKSKAKRSQLVWPSSTSHGENRTTAKIKRIVEEIELNPNLSAIEKKGVVGKSPLLELENFDFVYDSPVEYMHAVCIGVVKRLVQLTFDVGEKRKRVTVRKLSNVADFNKLMLTTKVAGEFPRRARELDFAVMKAGEFRNILIFYFPHVLACIEKTAKERSVWLYLTFMVRACIVPQEEFHAISLSDIDFSSENFYLLYEKLFGAQNCTYNTHVVSAHIVNMRYHGPLTLTLAFQFENFYGEMRNAFVPGTQSTLKQIFEKILLKRSLAHHTCLKNLIFCDHDTSLECNTLIYIYKHSTYHIYTIVHIIDEELVCNKIETKKCEFPEVSKRLKWEKVGVFYEGEVQTEFVVILPKNVHGKVLRVGEYLITCPNEVLNET